MRSRQVVAAILFVLSPAVRPAAAEVKELVINLASTGETQTITVARNAEYQIKVENMLPTARYSSSVEIRHPDVDPLSIGDFTVGGEALGIGQAAPPARAAARDAAIDCTGLIDTFVHDAWSVTEESSLGKVVATALAKAGGCRDQLDSVVAALTRRTLPETTPAPGTEREVVITIVREGNPGRKWQLVLTHSSAGEWRVSYGFTFVKNRDKRYFSEADATQQGKFKIVRQADRERADFIPSIFFSWHGTGRRWGPGFGLGYDLESPALFLGTGWKYRQNIMVTGGLAIHGRQELKGRYDPNDSIGENLGEDQLTERSFTPNIYLGATFRFGANIHAQRAAALTKLAAERKKAADEAKRAAEAAKKEEEKKKAALELCEKQVQHALAKDMAECAKKPVDQVAACNEVANAKSEEGKASCRKKDAEGALAGDGSNAEARVVNENPPAASRAGAAALAKRPQEVLEVSAVPTPLQRRCATPPLSPETRARNLELMSRFRARNLGYELKSGRVEIPIYFHVIHNGAEGALNASQIDVQIAALNQVFGAIGFTFTLAGTDYTDSSAWFRMGMGSIEEVNAKWRLGKITDRALNLYSCAPPGYLGWATLPIWLRDYPDYDGVIIHYQSLPGGDAPFDLGMTGVHEVGHWLGLEHTFNGWDEKTAPDGGCYSPGDSIDDTPYEGAPTNGPGEGKQCPAVGSQDTCPLIAGADPIDNFMDYADDRCMLVFTAGQVAWMKQQTALYRRLLLQKATGEIRMFVPPE